MNRTSLPLDVLHAVSRLNGRGYGTTLLREATEAGMRLLAERAEVPA